MTHSKPLQLMTKSSQIMTLPLSDGIMELSDGKLIITDKAKKDRILLLLISIASILVALTFIYKGKKLVLGSIHLFANIGLLWKWYKEFSYVETLIKFSDIIKIKMIVKIFSGTKVGLIHLKNNKVRRIKMEYKDFLKLKYFMKANNIEVTP